MLWFMKDDAVRLNFCGIGEVLWTHSLKTRVAELLNLGIKKKKVCVLKSRLEHLPSSKLCTEFSFAKNFLLRKLQPVVLGCSLKLFQKFKTDHPLSHQHRKSHLLKHFCPGATFLVPSLTWHLVKTTLNITASSCSIQWSMQFLHLL